MTEVAVQGSAAADAWVTGYSLSYKQNTAPWTFVFYTTEHSLQVCVFLFITLVAAVVFVVVVVVVVYCMRCSFLLNHFFTIIFNRFLIKY